MVLRDIGSPQPGDGEERANWQVRSSELILDHAPWLRVWQQEVVLPNGQVIPKYLLTKGRSFAMVFPLTPAGQVVMVEQYRHGLGRWTLDLPAGYLEDDDDSPLETARRELLEETGYVAEGWEPLGEFAVNPNRGNDRVCFFLARGARQMQGQHLDATEDIQVLLVPLAKVVQLVTEGRVQSLSTMGGILLGLQASNS